MVDSFVSALCSRHASLTAVKSLSWDAFLFLGIPLNSPLDYLTTRQVIGPAIWGAVGENQVNCAEAGVSSSVD